MASSPKPRRTARPPRPPEKILVVAEKAPQGREIAQALVEAGWARGQDGPTSDRGVLLAQEGKQLLVAWAEGHLLEMLEPDAQSDDWGSPWRPDVLPMIPSGQWIPQRPRDGKSGRARELCSWMAEASEVVNACDAGTEGELIFDEIVRLAGLEQDDSGKAKPCFTRMWISDTRPIGLRDAFDSRKRASLVKYCHLREAAWARAQADWLYGFNATRMATLAFVGRGVERAHVGRVQTPTLAAVAKQDVAIAKFVSEPFLLAPMTFRGETGAVFRAFLVAFPEIRFGNIDYHFHPRPELFDYRNELLATKDTPWTVSDQPVDVRLHPPPPFDLLDLQRCASRIFGWTAAKTLSLAQNLYLREKAISYPRTSSTKVPPAMRKEVEEVREKLYYDWALARFPELNGAILPTEEAHWDEPDGDHYAILPTGNIPSPWAGANELSEEYQLWRLIVVRTILAWLPPASIATVKRHLLREWKEGYVMRAFAEAEPVDVPGWLWWEDRMMNTRGYGPPLAERMREVAMPDAGNFAKLEAIDIKRGATSAPESFNEASLLGWMGRFKMGTPATRHHILEELVRNGFLRREESGVIRSTNEGRILVTLLEEALDEEATGVAPARQLEEFLLRVAGMAKERPDRLKLWDAMSAKLRTMKRKLLPETETAGAVVGGQEAAFCPRTGNRGSLHETGKYFEFAGYKEARCWRTMFGREMSAADYVAIFAGGDRGGGPFKDFCSKMTGTKFDAHLVWRPRKKAFELLFKR